MDNIKTNVHKGDEAVETVQLVVDNNVDNENIYQQAVDILKKGGLVAFPTETVYGLGALATDEAAVARIFEAKGRPADNPLIVHIGTTEEAYNYAQEVSPDAQKLMAAFWPGPLTLVFAQRPDVIAPNVTPDVHTIGLRMPNHPVALSLLRALGGPLAAPSANRSGKPSPTEAAHVNHDLGGKIPLILDGGRTGIGVESTVLDMTSTPPVILRPGGITREMIEEVIGPIGIETTVEPAKAPRSPGMKYMHYAPEAPLFVIDYDASQITAAIQQLHAEGQKVALIGPDELQDSTADWYFAIGSVEDKDGMAANLYRALRQCDLTDADVILAVETDLEGVGEAFMNRLLKAADGKHYN